MRGIFLSLTALLLFGGFPQTASAHLGSVTFVDITPRNDGADFVVDVECVDAAMELGLAEDASEDAIRVRRRSLEAWILEGVVLRTHQPCAQTIDGVGFVDRELGRYLRFEGTAECSPGPLRLRDDTIFDDDPQHETLVRVVQGGQVSAQVLRGGSREVSIELLGNGALFIEFLKQGALHFALGFDHILFLLTLIFGVALGWRSKDTSTAALRSLAWLVTAFTLGHTLTLVSAALELVSLPIRPVEVAIAASIVVVAVWNMTPYGRRHERPWAAFGFGLIHGFGFSSVLADVGLPGGRRALALTGFNLGIEAAQLAFVALCFGPLLWLSGQKSYQRITQAVSLIVVVCAMYWVFDRI
jgi:hypothetical protein